MGLSVAESGAFIAKHAEHIKVGGGGPLKTDDIRI